MMQIELFELNNLGVKVVVNRKKRVKSLDKGSLLL